MPLCNSSSHTVNEPTAWRLHKRTYGIASQIKPHKHTHTHRRMDVEKSDKAKNDGDYDT